jgi:hypothetical protein
LHELKHLEQTWQKQMLGVVKIKGMSAPEIVGAVQEMTIVQGGLAAMCITLENEIKRTT